MHRAPAENFTVASLAAMQVPQPAGLMGGGHAALISAAHEDCADDDDDDDDDECAAADGGDVDRARR